jgi:hypothetical protein
MIRGSRYSYPEITSQVRYIVSTLFDPEKQKFELIGVYVFQNPATLCLLIEFLANLDVYNENEKAEAIMGLRELLWSITEK